MVKDYQNGVIAQLLEAIVSQVNFDGEPISNIGDILLSILEKTPYDKEPKSVLAELFLKLKNKLEGKPFTPYDKEPKSVLAEILLSILNETEYTDPPTSRIGELLLELKAELESYAEITTSGAIANFTTSLIKPLVNLIVNIGASVSGVNEVSVFHCGANLWDEVWELGAIDNQTGQNTDNINTYRSKNYIQIPKGENLYLVNGNSDTLGFRFYDSNKNFIGSRAFLTSKVMTYGTNDLPIGTAYIRFINTSTNAYLNNIAINYQSSDTEYHAYNGNTKVIDLGGTYYNGGTLTQDKYGNTTLTADGQTIDLPKGEPIVTLNGVNNIYNDSGDTSVTYLALISDNITRGAKMRAVKKAEKIKLIEQEKQPVIIDPIETKETKETKAEGKK